MLPAKGAGVAHRVSGADARRNDQLGGKVGLLATGSHGWLHGDYHTAHADAQWLAQNLGLPIRSAAA
jgi:hypothetical protein